MKKTNNDALIGEMDAFAAELLAGSKTDKTSVQAKIDVFRTITQWVGVRNRISVEEGADLDGIRDKLKQADAPEGAPVKRRGRPPKSAAVGNSTGGSALAAIRRKLPRQNGGDARSDRRGAERPDAPADSGSGSVHADSGDDF